MDTNVSDYDMISKKKYLLFSSSFFIIPFLFSFIRKPFIYILSLDYFITFVCSINYWKYPVIGIRRNIDLFVANSSFIITFTYGVLYVKTIY